jgi:predicted nicotinamide N-methyase
MSVSSYNVNGKTLRIHETKLHEEEDSSEDSDGVDAFFFASENLAASTGQKVWESASLAIEVLEEKQSFVAGKNVLELGSGTGLVGLACGCLEAKSVVLSDLPSVIAFCTDENVKENNFLRNSATKHLDWLEFTESKGRCFPEVFDIIVACDCVWLAEFLSPFCFTLATLLKRNSSVALVAQTERATEESTVFASSEKLLKMLESFDLKIKVLKSREKCTVYQIECK